MTVAALPRPADDEYAEYYRRYVSLVPDGNIVDLLRRQIEETASVLQSAGPAREVHRYAPGKWSLREVVGHMIDTERVFAYRALSMARGDAGPLPGMDQDVWTPHSGAHSRHMEDLVEEARAIRHANVLLFGSLDAEAGVRTGVASGNSFTVRAFPWIIAGHELHHLKRIREDYLGEPPA